MKRLISHITTFAMIMTLFAGIGSVSAEESGTITQIESIGFGSYPQTEIVGEASQSGAYGKAWKTDGDYEVDSELYTKLKEDTDWNKNDKVIDNVKYHRILKSDATYTYSSSNYYKWSDSTTYHYFRYDPIKWRVLDINGDDAFLLSEIALDDQNYNLSRTSITWEKSTVRSWLNGYGSSVNTYGKDYTSGNFIDCAFTEDEQAAIISTEVKNENNKNYGTNGGNNTTDKVFLLSESEIYGSDAVKHGFEDDYSAYDKARRSKSSTYAKAIGVYSYCNSSCLGNCSWWLRSPGGDSDDAAYVNYIGCVCRNGNIVNYNNYAIRPALHLNMKADNMYKKNLKDEVVKASDAKLSKTSYVYSGKANKPAVTVSGLNNGKDYTVSYSNNTKCGKATVKIKGIGNYTGTITKTFNIKPAKAGISKVAAGSKKLTVTIKSQKTSGVTGYEINYKKSGSAAKTVTVSGTSKTLSGLTKGKKYTVKVRAYKTIDGKKVFGDYSASKTVTVK